MATASARSHYRTCTLCHEKKHPDDVHVFEPEQLGNFATSICWSCIENVIEHLDIQSELAKLELRKKIA